MLSRPHRSVGFLLAAVLACTTFGCVDHYVQNPNEPDGARALVPENVEALLASAFEEWMGVQFYSGPVLLLSVASGQHSSWSACCGMELFARIPRVATRNQDGGRDVGNLTYAWYKSYETLWDVRVSLQEIADGSLRLDAEETLRAQAYGRFVQGLAHGTLALLYDSAYVSDETLPLNSQGLTLEGYQAIMDAALGYLDDAIALADSGTFTIPATWLSREVSSTTLARLAHSWRARLQANVARTPAERRAVDWNVVEADVGAGITEDWEVVSGCELDIPFCEEALLYMQSPGRGNQGNWFLGMADQSGAYQAWIHTPVMDRLPFLIVTPDTRLPSGADESTQLANPGEYYAVNDGWTRVWRRPDRGTWRWSYYDLNPDREPYASHTAQWGGGVAIPQITVREMRALEAEASYYRGDLAAVASFVNETRTLHGLQETDAEGINADCVPRLPSGACGDLWEMFKWEKRLETQYTGPLRVGWYFDGRGWGDLLAGTILQFPVPYREMEILDQHPYDFGGVDGEWGAAEDSYGFVSRRSDVAAVRVEPPETTLAEGDEVQLTATALDVDSDPLPGRAFTWSSSDSTVATVDSSGTVTAVAEGVATVSAVTEWAIGSATVTVRPVAHAVVVSPDSVTCLPGDTRTFIAFALDLVGGAIPDVTFDWSSSDESVATINSAGLATAVGDGVATIIATADGVSDSALVTVRTPFTVVVSPDSVTFTMLWDTATFTAVALDAVGGTIPEARFAWSSSDESVTTVGRTGLATAVGNGVATVTATAGGVSDSVVVTVRTPPTVVVTPEEEALEGIGTTYTFEATARNESGVIPSPEITWSSLNPNIATIDVGGTVTALTSGQVTIAAEVEGAVGYALLTVSVPGVGVVTAWHPDTVDARDNYLVAWGASASDVFVTGDGFTPILHFDGVEWSAMTSRDFWLSGIWGAGPSDVFAVGAAGDIQRYDGADWHTLASGTTQSLLGVWGASPADVIAVGPLGYALHFDGSKWQPLDMPRGDAFNRVKDVWGTSRTNVFAVGDAGDILHFDGDAWTYGALVTRVDLFGIWGTSRHNIFVVGDAGTILHYDGVTWNAMNSGTTVRLRDVWGTSVDDVYVVGSDGTILHYNGTSWSQLSSPTTRHLSGVWCTSSGDVFVVGGEGTLLRGER